MKNSKSFYEIFSGYSGKRHQMGLIDTKQRRYEWRKSEIIMLLKKIESLLEYTKDSHLGYHVNTIAIFENNDDHIDEVIDGGQRNTTMLLLFICLRNFILNKKLDSNNGLKLIIDDINRIITRRSDNKCIWQPIPVDRKVFEDILNNNSLLLNRSYEDRSRLYNAYTFIYDYYNDKYNQLGENFLYVYMNDVLRNVRTNVLEPETRQEADMLFQTLNGYGLALSENTKITAEISKRLSDYIDNNNLSNDEFNRYYEKLSATARMFENNKKIFSYYYYYLTDIYVSPRKITQKFIDYIDDVLEGEVENSKFKNILDLIDNLEKFTRFSVMMSNKDFGKNESKDINYLVSICDMCVYIEIAIIDMFTDKYDYNFSNLEKEKILNYLMIILIRGKYMKYGSMLSHPEKQICGVIGKCINIAINNNKSIDKVFIEYIRKDDLINVMGYIDDDSFIENIPFKSIYAKKQTGITKYLLTKLNNKLGEDEQILFGNHIDNTVEHIIPQCDNENEKYLHTIGNLTVLSRKLNSKLKNISFKDKKPTFEQSSLHINQYLKSKDDFTWNDVIERSKFLAPIMCDVFRID